MIPVSYIGTTHIGKDFVLLIKSGSSVNGRQTIKGKIESFGGSYYLLHNASNFHGGSTIPNQRNFTYCTCLGNGKLRDYISGILSFEVSEDPTVFFIKNENGFQFRRVYFQTNEILVWGPVRKDIEDCKTPSSILTTVDIEYVTKKGWKIYELEIPAEKQVNTKPVVN